MKAAIYCRVSTEDQEREGTSLVSQKEACIKKAEELGYNISDEFIILETYSGLSLNRPKLDQLRQWVRDKQVDAVIAYTLDRLSRDPVHFIILQEELERVGVELIMVTEDVDSSDMGKLIAHIKGFAAKLEAEKIKERTMRGKRERIKNGKLPTGRGVLYGYDYDKERGINVANNDLDTVKMMGQWLIQEGIFLNEVCRRLMEKGIPAPKGGYRWSRGTVGRIMRNPVYAGKSYAGQTRTEGKKRVRCSETDHILIPDAVNRTAFTWEDWEIIQRQLDRNRELSPRNQKLSYLLSGRLFCKSCGRKYCGIPVHGKPYYRCSGRVRLLSDKCCTSKTINAGKLDESVWTEVAEALKNPRTILAGLQQLKGGMNQEGFLEEEVDRITKRIKTLDTEQERLLQWALKGFPEETVVKENEKINRERTELQRGLEETEKKLEQAIDSHIDLDKVEEFCMIASQNLSDFGYTEKKLALEAFKVRVWIDGNNTKLDGVLPVPDEVCAMSQHS
ncbi:recombinase family protein [Chloroflexota bacterium]